MTDDTMALLEQIQKSSDGDFLRAIAEHALHRLMAFPSVPMKVRHQFP